MSQWPVCGPVGFKAQFVHGAHVVAQVAPSGMPEIVMQDQDSSRRAGQLNLACQVLIPGNAGLSCLARVASGDDRRSALPAVVVAMQADATSLRPWLGSGAVPSRDPGL